MIMRHSNYRPAQSKGLALVELMIAMTLGLVLIGAATAVMLSNSQSFRATRHIAQAQDNAKLGFELMARDIRQAGSIPCGNGVFVENSLPEPQGGFPWYLNWDGKPKQRLSQNQNTKTNAKGQLIGYAAAFSLKGIKNKIENTESITLTYASNEGSSLKKFEPSGSIYTFNQPNNNFKSGDIAFVCNTEFARIFSVEVSGGGTDDMSVTATEGNTASKVDIFFKKNAVIGKLKSRAWYIGENAEGKRSLYLAELQGSEVQSIEIASGVNNLKLLYRADKSTEFKPANDIESANLWPKVNAVQITLELLDQSQPNNDERFERSFTSIVAVRNAR